MKRKILGTLHGIALVGIFTVACQSKKKTPATDQTSLSETAVKLAEGSAKSAETNSAEKTQLQSGETTQTPSSSEVQGNAQGSKQQGWDGIEDIRATVSRKLLLSNLAVTEQLTLLPSGSVAQADTKGGDQKTVQSLEAKIPIQRRFESALPFKFQIALSNEDSAYAVHEKFPSYRNGAALCQNKDEFFSFTPPMDGSGKFFEKSKPTRIYVSGLSSALGEKTQLIWRKEKTHKWDAQPNLIVSADCNNLAFVGIDADTKQFSVVSLKRPRSELLGDGSRAPWEETVFSGRGLTLPIESLSKHLSFFTKVAGEDLNVALLTKAGESSYQPTLFEVRKSKTSTSIAPRDFQKFWTNSEVKGNKDCGTASKNLLKIASGELWYVSGSNLCSVNFTGSSAQLKKEGSFEKYAIESFDVAKNNSGKTKVALAVTKLLQKQNGSNGNLDRGQLQGMILASRDGNTADKGTKDSAPWKLSLIDEWKYAAQLASHHQVQPVFYKQGALLIYARPNLPDLTDADFESVTSSSEFSVELMQIEPTP